MGVVNVFLIIFMLIFLTFLSPAKGIILYELSLPISLIELVLVVFCLLSMNYIIIREINLIQWKISLRSKERGRNEEV